MNNKSSYLNLLGLAYRAGACTLGEEFIVKEIQQGRAKLVLLANDTGKQTSKKIRDKCKSYEVPCYVVDNRDILSQAIGKEGRVAISIQDKGFAKKFMTLLDESNRG
ncbi:YlxQ family RNA-binding protein [Saliterribacillus persicus]|uniref:Ribosomal protein L7Ae-like RNA K-turn-binding protein n=1 Tax=Saliterribacillus persicus TaxID=930114 RepID=A0A368XS33_9BACI|nr:YlxQ family RNA-binding protein [Saliterribacillus persicus]RCW70675.1 ribosomal protein L7Ae-like RNA K-turn-binding protein [Saliterribacillus persicus]